MDKDGLPRAELSPEASHLSQEGQSRTDAAAGVEYISLELVSARC